MPYHLIGVPHTLSLHRYTTSGSSQTYSPEFQLDYDAGWDSPYLRPRARAISNKREAILKVDMKFKRRMSICYYGFSNSTKGFLKLGFTQIIRES